MKILVLLFAALLVAGCGDKSESEGPETTPAPNPESESSSSTSESVTLPWSDADIKRLLEVAVEQDSLQERDGLLYRPNESKPYNGWVKQMYESGQAEGLGQVKEGIPDGTMTMWHENGQKSLEGTIKGHGELVSGTFWNSKGEEVETREEAFRE